MEKFGEQFLHQKDSKLHTFDKVEHEMERKKRNEENVSQKPADKIEDWLSVIKKTHTGHNDDPRVLERIKKYYHKEYVIKQENIPESYFDNQKRLARERGYGDIEIDNDERENLTEVIISDQKSTLDNWVNYLSSPDSDSFPMWAKYLAFNGMIKMSAYDKRKHTFGNRKKDTVAPFPDLNREALVYVIDVVVKKVNKENIEGIEDNHELQKLLEGINFAKLYAYAIEKVTPTEQNELLNTEGVWLKYPQNSDHMSLVNSLQGHGTGWCTAGETTAKSQLSKGDFYVYYSQDKKGNSTIPRAAIRMENSKIAEVRGVAFDQNLDPYIGEVVKEKLGEFSDGESYNKKTGDMEKLTMIDKKNQGGEKLTKEDLLFLYEINSKIEGFGHGGDSRIKEIIKTRNFKDDYSIIFDCTPDKISTTKEEALRGGMKYHIGNLDLRDKQSAGAGLELPEIIDGDVDLSNLRSAVGLKFPRIMNGDLNLKNLRLSEGLNLPEKTGTLILSGLISVNGLKFPDSTWDLFLNSLQSAKGLNLPNKMSSLFMLNLQSTEGLDLNKEINGTVGFNSLESDDFKYLRNKYPNLSISKY